MTDTFTLIAGQRRAVADVLDTLNVEQWNTSSLCEGWTVREVAAHLAMPLTTGMASIMWRMLKAKGNFDKVADDYARTASSQTTSQLVAAIRDNAEHRFTPPGAGPEAPLTDLLVHGLDIGVPVDRRVPVPDEVPLVVLPFLFTKPARRGFVPESRVTGLRFAATDLDWSTGDGPLVEGPAQSLALSLAGRPALVGDLTGDGVAEFTSRIS
ncbi:MAG: maleylpyruvate isomerase family mycothiol-dependent enzyme [Acidimicrobiia bacterium]